MIVTRILGAAVAVAIVGAMVPASRLRIPLHAEGDAMLRITFTARPERVETCKTASEEELAALPAHMRQRVVCEGGSATYHLAVRRDGELVAFDTLRGGGLRQDRQLYYFRELRVPPGRAAFDVTLVRADSATATPADSAREGDEGEARRRRRADELHAPLVLRETVLLAPREVMLVTYDRSTRQLRTGGREE